MVIAVLRVEVRLRDASSPRQKRRLIRLLIQRVHRVFNVSAAEVELDEHPSESVLAFVAVAASKRDVRASLLSVLEALTSIRRLEITGQTLDEV
jgi:uncharacterized protein YlxP (DUF503 family)